jgi:putative peptidoglycan lipid II flippase
MRIFRAATIVAGATLIVKFGGLAKELTVAGYFGRSDDLEAFMMALLLPSFMLSIIAGGSNSSIIPVLVDLQVNHGRSEAQRLMSSVACLGGGLLLTVTLLLALAAPLILPGLCPGFSQEKLKMTERIFYWLLPALFIRGFSAMWADILNAGHKFALASLTPLATSLSIALALLALGRSYGANTLVGAFLVGSFLEATLLSSALRREGWSLIPRWHGMDRHIKAVIKQYLPGVASAILMGSSDIIDNGMAAALPAGSVAALGYGNKITSFVLGIGASSLTTAALPHLSTMAAERRIAEMHALLWRYVQFLLLVSVPLTVLLIACSREIVALLFQRGAFSASDTAVVAGVQSALLLQVPFFLISGFTVRFVMAFRANRIMFWGTAICASVNVIGNYVFMIWFGVVGIALSTALVYAISAAYLLFMTTRLIHSRKGEAP